MKTIAVSVLAFCVASVPVAAASSGPAIPPAPVATLTPIPSAPPAGVTFIRSSIGVMGSGGMLYRNPNASGPTLNVTGTGTVTRAADRATVTISVNVSDAQTDATLASIGSAVESLQREIERLHGTRVVVQNESINAFSPNGVAAQMNGNALLEVSVDDLSVIPQLRRIVAGTPGSTLNNLRYDIRNRSAANAAAIAAAVADLKAQVDALVSKSGGLKIGGQRSFQANVPQGYGNDSSTVATITASATASYDVSAP